MTKTRPMTGISDRLAKANVAISNALSDAQIGKLLGEYGYQTQKLSEGKGLLEAADLAVKKQVAAHGDQKEATARFLSAEKTSKTAYQNLAQVARAAFARDKAKLAVLGLNAAMPKTLPLFLTMATALFDNASHTAEIAETLKGYGYSADKLAKERAKIVELSAADQAQESAKGAAQQATFEQNKAMEILDYWMGGFVKVAKVALREQPQLLEKLGILKRGGKTAAQRKAPGKAAATRAAKKAPKA
ncbi:MAG TPA: hypothetical protein PLQ05_02860 [Acidobacteriota bacterium]|nr:hypothetical protein [Acidobacteriota bacterium]HQO21132.1 hypothetical protein [Acidobacteriota bacterium]